jgi:CHAD domain-containing protein
MAHVLEAGEPVAQGIRRIALGQLGEALSSLQGQDSRHEAVHRARKCCKFIRALLRLVRDELGASAFAAENAFFRQAQRRLSAMRDAVILVSTLDALVGLVDGPALSDEAYDAARAVLVERCRRRERQDLQDDGPYGEALQLLSEAPARIAAWPLCKPGFGLLRPGLHRLYGSARRGHRGLDAASPAEDFHEWRKRLKALMHALDVLRPVWPAVMKAMHDELHGASDLVGADHDLEMLRLELAQDPHEFGPPETGAALLARIEARRAALRTAVLPLGERLLHEKPGRFVDRLQTYWRSWGALEDGEPQAA